MIDKETLEAVRKEMALSNQRRIVEDVKQAQNGISENGSVNRQRMLARQLRSKGYQLKEISAIIGVTVRRVQHYISG